MLSCFGPTIEQRSTKWTIYGDEDSNPFDYSSARTIEKRVNLFEAVANVVKGALGIGVLGLHKGFYYSGLYVGTAATLIFGIYIAYCINILITAAHVIYKRLHVPNLSYSELAEVSFAVAKYDWMRRTNRCFRRCVEVTICIDLFGSCAVYHIFIAKTIKQLVEKTNKAGNDPLGDSPHIRVYIAGLIPLILLIVCIRNLKYIAPLAIVANALVATTVITTIYYGVSKDIPLENRAGYTDIEGFLRFMGTSVFSMESVGIALAVENTMKKPMHYYKVNLISHCFIVTAATCVGFFGYWAYGNDVEDIIVLNFPINEPFTVALKILMAFSILVTYAVNFWVPFNIVWIYLKDKYRPERIAMVERLYRMFIALIIALVAIGLPTINNIMSFLGAFCLSAMGFMYPSLIQLAVVAEKPGMKGWKGGLRWFRCMMIFMVGLAMWILGTLISVKNIILDAK